jgi:HK97 family phage major capsid protein
MSKLRELQEKRSAAIASARVFVDKADAEKRGLNDDETKQYDAFMAEAVTLRESIERETRLQEEERSAAAAGIAGLEKKSIQTPEVELRTKAFRNYIVGGKAGLAPEELRALSAGSPTAGGYLVAPEEFVAQLIKAVDDLVFVRQRATKFRLTSSASLGAPSLDANPADADWTTELLTGNEDSTMAVGKRTLTPSPFAKRIKVSNKLIQIGAINPEALVLDRLAYKFSITEEKGFMTGDGNGKPLGLFTASANGISTGRDYSTSNAATAPTFDGLIGAKYTLKGAYWPKAAWMFHRDCLAILAKIKDGDGQYIWRESVRAGEPDTLLNMPVNMSEYVPNTFTTGLYVGILGDFSNYWIADALDIQIQRLTELYAETNQVGFIGRKECDGMPVLEEAFVRVKLG